MADPRKLARVLRVRTLQLGQVQALELQAEAKLAQEAALAERIAQLSADVAPAAGPTPSSATSFAAAAHFRDRLNQSAAAAQHRLAAAEMGLDRARHASREARRDQSAIEKLIARAEAEGALKALRALEALPPLRKNRHDPC